MLYPKEYQKEAIDSLKMYVLNGINGDNRPIVFKSPTGSGKTFMISQVINEIVAEHEDDNFCFIWASIGKGELHIQSKDAVSSYLEGYPECSLLEEDFFGSRKYIKNKEVVFVNWEKLINKDGATGHWKNNLMKDQEGQSFLDVLEETRKRNTKIILIVDESHIGDKVASRITEFKDEIIMPNFVIEMSATPTGTPTVEVQEDDVIEAGMIKVNIIVNEGITKEDRQTNELDSEQLVLTKAEEKRKELIEEYKKQKVNINPLVLVQIPNSEAGEDKKIIVQDFLRDKGITVDNGLLKLWCDNAGNFDKKLVRENDDKTCYLIFKTAVATGWDCPRAHVLVKFREGKSETFEIQTIGRILRTAEAKHYDNEILDDAYIFTNEKDFETKKETYSPNRIKTAFSTLGKRNKDDIFEQTKLVSYYRSRQGNYNAADSRIDEYIEKEFMAYFNLNDDDKYSYDSKTILEKFAKKGLIIEKEDKTSIIESRKFIYHADDEKNYRVANIEVKNAANDIKSAFNKIVSDNLNGLAYVRSKTPINTAIISVFSKFYNEFPRSEKISSIETIVVNHESIFAQIINKATYAFKQDYRGKYSWDKYDYKFDYKRAYSVDCNVELDIKKALYHPFSVRLMPNGKPNELEKEFLQYLDKSEEVNWIFENGTELMRINFGIPYNNNNSTFQPDFIIKFANGDVGIFDTKPIDYRQDDTKEKAEALAKYISSINRNRGNLPKVIGGIVVQQKTGGKFYYNSASIYKDMAESNEDWVLFDELLEKVSNDEYNRKALKDAQ